MRGGGDNAPVVRQRVCENINGHLCYGLHKSSRLVPTTWVQSILSFTFTLVSSKSSSANRCSSTSLYALKAAVNVCRLFASLIDAFMTPFLGRNYRRERIYQ